MGRTSTRFMGGFAVAAALALVVAGCAPGSVDTGNGNTNGNANTNGNGNGNANTNDNGGGSAVVANAGPDQDVNGGDIVQLDGSASTGVSMRMQQTKLFRDATGKSINISPPS